MWTKAAAPNDPTVGRRIDALELAFSPDARWIAVGSAGGGTVTLVDRATGNFTWTVPGPRTPTFGQVRALRFSADNRFLYCGSGDSQVRKLRVGDGAVLWKAFAGGWPDVTGLNLTPRWLVASSDATTGTALAEIYDGTPAFGASTPRLINVSARTEVTAANLLIAGFVIAGSTARTVLIRGIGPTLASFGLRTALRDPQLTLYRDGTLVAANDHWHDAANAVAVATAAAQVGAFALSPISRDAALLLSLPPGSYTAQVSGANGATSGEALVEVYEVP